MIDTKANDMAFPSTFHNGWGEPEKGMTLRDYFAAKALECPQAPSISLMTQADGTNVIDPWPCEWAYMVADAMLKAREA